MPRTIHPPAYKVYKLSELKRPAKEKAFADYQNMMDRSGSIPWADETFESLEAIIKAAGLKLGRWEIGAYAYSHLSVSGWTHDETAELTGARAMAWLENNLLKPLRIPWNGKRWELAKYGVYYRPGMIKPCPFTGYCGDEMFLDSLRKSIKNGDTLKEAFEELADVCRQALESENEYQRSKEAFEEWACDMEFRHDGSKA